MSARGDDCEVVSGETCPEGSSPGSVDCSPVEIMDCPRGEGGVWETIAAWAPIAIAVLLFLLAAGLLVWLLIEISRGRRDRARLAAALAEIERAKAAGHSQGSAAGGPGTDLLQRLVSLTDFPQAAAASEQLEHVLTAAGIVRFTVRPGDPFDDSLHMARVRRDSTDPASNRTIAEVIRPGFRTADHVLRRADVAVWMNS